MHGPPPPPRAAAIDAGRDELLAALRVLETPELLALCARFGRQPERLASYQALFRARPGARAQFAACLVGFDLARHGGQTAQREFHALAPTMRSLAADPRLVAELVGGDRYLEAQWRACELALRQVDPRDSLEEPLQEVEIVGEVDLLSQEGIDLGELEADPGVAQEERAERERAGFLRILAEQVGQDLVCGVTYSGEGFAVGTRAELDRFERFIGEAASRAADVPLAAGMACVGSLFLAAHLRRTSFFGGANPRRSAALKAGLQGLAAASDRWAAGAASLLALEGPEVSERFEKVTELLLDYLRFCAAERLDPLGSKAVEGYVRANREVQPVLSLRRGRRRR